MCFVYRCVGDFASVPSKRLIVKVNGLYKPISCHFISGKVAESHDGFTAVNYHRWEFAVCQNVGWRFE